MYLNKQQYDALESFFIKSWQTEKDTCCQQDTKKYTSKDSDIYHWDRQEFQTQFIDNFHFLQLEQKLTYYSELRYYISETTVYISFIVFL